MAPIDELPDEVLAGVFRALGVAGGWDSTDMLGSRTLVLHCPAVCRRWRDVLQSRGCRVKLNFRFAMRERADPHGGDGEVDTSVLATEHNVLTDAALGAMLGRFGGVDGLMLFGCNRLSDAGVAVLSAACPGLVWLCLASCGKGVTDVGLEAVSRGCPRLAFLDITKLTALSFDALEAVVRGCRGLKTLGAVGVPAKREVKRLLGPTTRLVTANSDLLHMRTVYLFTV
jgi:hypothetical protein